jgi:hypothetical protein
VELLEAAAGGSFLLVGLAPLQRPQQAVTEVTGEGVEVLAPKILAAKVEMVATVLLFSDFTHKEEA